MEAEKRWIASEVLFTAIEEELQEGRRASFTVTGMSMWPMMRHGCDRVVLEAVSPSKLRRGDIVLFCTTSISGKNYLMHRITKVKGDQFQSTGDGNCFRDGWFQKSAVIGRIITIQRPDQTIHCDQIRWHLFGEIWMLLYPVRGWMMKVWSRARGR